MVAKRRARDSRDGADTLPPARAKPVRYPERDGKPIAETQVHASEIIRLMQTLRDHYADRPDVYVWGDLLLYYEEGNPRASVAPDVFVAVGAAREPARRIYKLWEEGVPPTLVVEVTSPSTRPVDLGRKRDLYARLGVAEYVLYDPLGEYLSPVVQGFALARDEYHPMPRTRDGALVSRALGLRLLLVDGRLRLLDGETGAPLRSPEERVADAERRIAEAEQRIAELEAERHRRPS